MEMAREPEEEALRRRPGARVQPRSGGCRRRDELCGLIASDVAGKQRDLALGLSRVVRERDRSPVVTAVGVVEGHDDAVALLPDDERAALAVASPDHGSAELLRDRGPQPFGVDRCARGKIDDEVYGGGPGRGRGRGAGRLGPRRGRREPCHRQSGQDRDVSISEERLHTRPFPERRKAFNRGLRRTRAASRASAGNQAMVARIPSSERARVATRIQALNRQLKEGLARMPNVKVYTPRADALSAGLVCLDVAGLSPEAVVAKLGRKSIIASQTPYATSYARLTADCSTHPRRSTWRPEPFARELASTTWRQTSRG